MLLVFALKSHLKNQLSLLHLKILILITSANNCFFFFFPNEVTLMGFPGSGPVIFGEHLVSLLEKWKPLIGVLENEGDFAS